MLKEDKSSRKVCMFSRRGHRETLGEVNPSLCVQPQSSHFTDEDIVDRGHVEASLGEEVRARLHAQLCHLQCVFLKNHLLSVGPRWGQSQV